MYDDDFMITGRAPRGTHGRAVIAAGRDMAAREIERAGRSHLAELDDTHAARLADLNGGSVGRRALRAAREIDQYDDGDDLLSEDEQWIREQHAADRERRAERAAERERAAAAERDRTARERAAGAEAYRRAAPYSARGSW